MMETTPITVEVKRIGGKGRGSVRFFPCDQCIYKNVVKSKILMYNLTHAIYIRWKSFMPNLNSGQGQPYIEVIGSCPSFVQYK